MATKNITGNAGTLSLLGNNTVNVSGLTEANIGSPTIGSTTTINLEPGSELVGSIRDAAGTLNLTGQGMWDNTATKAAPSTIDSGTIGVPVVGTGEIADASFFADRGKLDVPPRRHRGVWPDTAGRGDAIPGDLRWRRGGAVAAAVPRRCAAGIWPARAGRPERHQRLAAQRPAVHLQRDDPGGHPTPYTRRQRRPGGSPSRVTDRRWHHYSRRRIGLHGRWPNATASRIGNADAGHQLGCAAFVYSAAPVGRPGRLQMGFRYGLPRLVRGRA